MNKEQYEALLAAIIEADEEAEPRSYSGRGMYGTYCLGVTTDDPLRLMLRIGWHLAASAADQDDEINHGVTEVNQPYVDYAEIQQALEYVSTDQMGRSSQIIYWPRIEWQEPDTEDEADQLLDDALFAAPLLHTRLK